MASRWEEKEDESGTMERSRSGAVERSCSSKSQELVVTSAMSTETTPLITTATNYCDQHASPLPGRRSINPSPVWSSSQHHPGNYQQTHTKSDNRLTSIIEKLCVCGCILVAVACFILPITFHYVDIKVGCIYLMYVWLLSVIDVGGLKQCHNKHQMWQVILGSIWADIRLHRCPLHWQCVQGAAVNMAAVCTGTDCWHCVEWEFISTREWNKAPSQNFGWDVEWESMYK